MEIADGAAVMPAGAKMFISGQAEKGAGMAGGEDPGGDASLNEGREPQQTQGVADLGPGASDPAGHFLHRAPEVIE